MWCLCCMTSFCSRTFYSLLSSSVINAVTILSDVTYVTVWQITSNPNPRVLKIEKWKINWMKMKMRKKMKTKSTFFNLDNMLFMIYHTITTRWIYYSHTLNIIVLIPSTMFQIYDIIPYDASCDYSYISLHYPRNKREIKSKKIEIKYKSLSIL